MSVARLELSARSNANRPDTARIVHALRSAAPALLFGLRLWTAVCLALYTAFWLQLDNAYWAGTSAAIVCQPSLGASLRKGWFSHGRHSGRRCRDHDTDGVFSATAG